MSNYQHNKNVKYNQSPYSKPSMHSKFDNRQSVISGRKCGTQSGRTVPSTPGHGRGSGTSSRRGYGFVGQKNSRTGYKKHDSGPHSPLNNIGYMNQMNRYQTDTKVYTTKSKYRRSEIIKDKILENEILIEGNGSIKEYVDYALNLFNKKTYPLIQITASGRAISKAINCVEMIKRKKYGLHQESRIKIGTIKEIWTPLEQCLKNVIIEHEIIYVQILLTFDNKLVNMNHIGYQEPISWIDLGDARELHDKMKGKMNKLQNKYDIQKTAMNKQTNDYNDIMNKFNALQKKFDTQESEYSDMKFLYDEQETAMNKQISDYNISMNKQTSDYNISMNELQDKYDLQEEQFTNMRGKYNKQEIRMNKQTNDYNINMNTLQNKYNSQESALSDIQHKYDEQEEINDLRMDKLGDKYDIKQGQFDDMENKYDTQVEQMKENKEQFDFLQNKYNKLEKHSNDRDANLRLKQNTYDNLDAKQLVNVIVSINKKRYQKYQDVLLNKFIEEGVDGSCLNQLTKDDLYGFGIKNYKDKIAIYKAIKQLFN